MENLVLVLVILIIIILLSINLVKSKKKNADFEKRFKPLIDIDKELELKNHELRRIEAESKQLLHKYAEAKKIYDSLKLKIKLYEDDLELLEFGVYEPHFDFNTSEEYKEKLTDNKDRQKQMVSEGKAAVCNTQWQVRNSAREGQMMIKRGLKLTLRAFNGECDSLISRVKWNNIEQIEKRIIRSFEAINKLNKSNDMHIMSDFLDLKIDELRLTHEYAQKKYEEKEEQKRIREQIREEERALREIEKARKEAEAEEKRYEKALQQAQKELKDASGKELEKLNSLISKLQTDLDEAHQAKERAISRAQLTKSGHVYVISNIGSFGKNIYKIGMTRRLEPMDRVKELGDASVPFQFDVHAMIYSDNAPGLENALHKEFNSKRVNLINLRKEYFNITLEEIEKSIKQNHDAEIEFTKLAEAKEYRESKAKLKEFTEELNKIAEEKEPEFPENIF